MMNEQSYIINLNESQTQYNRKKEIYQKKSDGKDIKNI